MRSDTESKTIRVFWVKLQIEELFKKKSLVCVRRDIVCAAQGIVPNDIIILIAY